MAHIYWIHLPKHNNILLEGYIGVSKQIEKRLNDHLYMLENNKHENIHLSRAFEKYKQNIIFDIILEGSEEYCYEIENKLRSQKSMGWNIAEGGSKPPSPYGNKHNLGRKLTEEHKRKISEKCYFKQYNKSEEHRKIASLTMKGKPKSDEQKKKQSDIMKIKAPSKIKIECPHCNKMVDRGNYALWHGDKCKHK